MSTTIASTSTPRGQPVYAAAIDEAIVAPGSRVGIRGAFLAWALIGRHVTPAGTISGRTFDVDPVRRGSRPAALAKVDDR